MNITVMNCFYMYWTIILLRHFSIVFLYDLANVDTCFYNSYISLHYNLPKAFTNLDSCFYIGNVVLQD